MRANYERFMNVATNGDLPRTIFPLPSRQLTTFNEGQLVPIYCQEVLPNQTTKITTRALIRGATPIFNVMDNSYCETFYFYVPNRLVWKHWREFLGENRDNAWDYEQPVYSVPQMTFADLGNNVGHKWTGELQDYFNIGAASYSKAIDPDDGSVDNDANAVNYNSTLANIKVNALPFRMYNLIYNEYFRDENTTPPIPVYDADDDDEYFKLIGTERVYKVRQASRYHDYFSSALPEPQKGEASYLPLDGQLAVITGGVNSDITVDAIPMTFASNISRGSLYISDSATNSPALVALDAEPSGSPYFAIPNNLYAQATSDLVTVEGLRQAIAVQRILELKARGGTRYNELLKSFFDVMVPDATIQRPEYLGGTKFDITQQQIVQSSSTDNTSPLGTVSAVSKSSDVHFDFEKSFVEHGFIIGLAVIRVNRSYQQGIERMWSRKDFYDYYLPQLANQGEQPIYRKELYATGVARLDNEVFGYQEAFASYTHKPSFVSGLFRRGNDIGNGLDAYHYADYYTETPYLSPQWMAEGTENIDKTLAVQSDVNHQFLCDFYFDNITTLPMPYYRIPSIESRY